MPATQLIRAFSALSPSERYALMLELAKTSESEIDLSDEDLARVGDELSSLLAFRLTGDERVITTVVHHTTSERGTLFEAKSNVRWLKDGVFDVQGIGTYPTVKLIRKLGELPVDQYDAVVSRMRLLLDVP